MYHSEIFSVGTTVWVHKRGTKKKHLPQQFICKHAYMYKTQAINDLLETHSITPRLMNKKQVSLNRQSFKTVQNLTVLMLGKCQILNSYSNCIR